MTTIHIQNRLLDGDSLPELQPLIGKTVNIVVREAGVPTVRPGTGDWSAWPAALNDLEGYDFDAYKAQREYDIQHAGDHLT